MPDIRVKGEKTANVSVGGLEQKRIGMDARTVWLWEKPGWSLWIAAESGWTMIQCDKCELCEIGPDGRKMFKCDPFSTIKEAECVAKWQLIRLDMLLGSYQSMLKWYGKLGPLQDKIFKYVQREINEMEESEGWKLDEPEAEAEDDQNNEWPL